MVSFYRKIWFWLLVAGIVISIIAVLIYTTGMVNEGTAYIVFAIGALLILSGGVVGGLTKEKPSGTQTAPVTSEDISTEELTKTAAMLTGTTQAELDLAIKQQLLQILPNIQNEK